MKKITLGLILGNLNPNFEYDIAQGVNKCAKEMDINVITLVAASSNVKDKLTDCIFDSYKFMGIDGLIIMYGSVMTNQTNIEVKNFLDKFNDIPYVIVQDNFSVEGKSNIIVDNQKGMKKCVEHLIVDHGYKNIVYLSGPKNNYDSQQRLVAYKETMNKYGLKVTNSMIEYGDFSENIEVPLKNLLKKNKHAEAIQFANDTMALASYQILDQMGYKIGKDIAVTGFDDVYRASIVHPALTTVSQEPLKVGYEATKEVCKMITTKKSDFITLDTNFVARKSCGCRREIVSAVDLKSLDEDEIIDYFIKESALTSRANINLKELKRVSSNVLKRIKGNYTVDEIVYYIKNAILNDENPISISYDDVFTYFTGAMKKYIDSVSDLNLKEKTTSILFNMETWYFNFVTNEIISANQSRLDKITNISLISRKMLNDQLTKTEMFEQVFYELKQMGVKSSYIYLFDNSTNKKAYLKAFFNENETKIFKGSEKKEKKLTNNFNNNQSGTFSYSFSLSSNEKYYGFMVCETNLSLIDLIELLCAQIGTLLYINEIRKSELKSQLELKKSLKLIQEKNEILNNLSVYDELTHIYNRRGFIEKFAELIKDYEGKEIELIFCDVDHLKEINDNFGHKEGDYAISTSAKLLEKALPKNAILSRLGGDEFVAIYPIEYKYDVVTKTKEVFEKFNIKSKKQYYIETSVGYYDFIANDEIKITNLLNEADKYLYKAKQKRRTTVQK